MRKVALLMPYKHHYGVKVRVIKAFCYGVNGRDTLAYFTVHWDFSLCSTLLATTTLTEHLILILVKCHTKVVSILLIHFAASMRTKCL